MKERFISEALKPVTSTFDTSRMSKGEPGLPGEFTWHGERIRIAKVCREWRETGPCHHGSGEQYVRKHWYEVEDDAGRLMKIYFERHPRGKQTTARWRLFSMAEGSDNRQKGAFRKARTDQ
jgi:hypothetical protein